MQAHDQDDSVFVDFSHAADAESDEPRPDGTTLHRPALEAWEPGEDDGDAHRRAAGADPAAAGQQGPDVDSLPGELPPAD